METIAKLPTKRLSVASLLLLVAIACWWSLMRQQEPSGRLMMTVFSLTALGAAIGIAVGQVRKSIAVTWLVALGALMLTWSLSMLHVMILHLH